MTRIALLALFCCLGVASFTGCGKKNNPPLLDPYAALEDEGPEIPAATYRRIPRFYSKDRSDFCEPLDGNWYLLSASLAGSQIEGNSWVSSLLRFDDEAFEMNVADTAIKGSFEINSSTSPRQLSIQGSDLFAGKSIMAIYDFPEAGVMRICYDLTGVGFPKDFESTPENGYFLATFKRSESVGRDNLGQLSMNFKGN